VTSGKPERPKSRTFTREFKAKIVAEFGALPTNSPERGALLRKNRLYHSHIEDWRRQLDCRGEGNGLAAVITNALEQARSSLVPVFRARIGHKIRNARALPQAGGSGLGSSKVVRVFKFMPLNSAPGRIRTCAHGSGGRCSLP
jgi:hypothetical protein